MYKIGDKVWYASRGSTQEKVVCPECFGKKYLTVILGDDSKVTIDCAGCASGYDPPKGYITHYKQHASVSEVIIDEIQINRSHTEYKIYRENGCHSIAKDGDVFSSKKEAEIRAKKLVEEWNKEQIGKIHRKEKNSRTWSWHVHYYRKQIREAEKKIKYAKERLDAARVRARQSKRNN